MACLMKLKSGCWKIQFVGGDRRRKALYPGAMPRKAAETITAHVEALLAAVLSNSAPESHTATWLGSIAPKLRRKLVRVGLASQRIDEVVPPTVGPTVAAFIDDYLGKRKDVMKYRTMNGCEQDRDSLVAFLGPDRLLDSVTAGDADEFANWLRTKESRPPKKGRSRTDKGFSEATIGRRIRRCSQFFRAAVRKKLITDNPFDGIKAPSQENESRFRFVTREETAQLIEACPDWQWRLIVALSRYGGLRCPSETLALTWGDVDWDRNRIRVPSPKTERYKGKAFREIPLFPELRPYLQDAWDALGDEPATHVITRYRDASGNLRTQFVRIIKRAGLEPWERVFHNLRASRQNELAASYPIHVVCRWIGNSALIADKHYLSGTDDYFEMAVGENGAQSIAEGSGTERIEANGAKSNPQNPRKTLKNKLKEYPQGESNPCLSLERAMS